MGHVNAAIRGRKQSVDSVLLMRAENWKPGPGVLFPAVLLFAVVRRNTFYMSQFTHLERKFSFLYFIIKAV